MSLTDRQRAAAQANHSVAVTAGAGTGKTHMLAERYVFYLQQGYSPLEVVAATFTDKAAAELRSRIRSAAQKLPHASDSLAELEAAQIGTLHALAARICREHPTVAGTPPGFALLDDLESQLWQVEQLTVALDALPDSIYAKIPYSQLEKALLAMLNDPIAAARALQQDTRWADLVIQIRQQALTDLLKHPAWRSAQTLLPSFIGASSDTLEQNRQIAIAALEQVRQTDVETGLETIAALNLRAKGSAKNWQSGGQLDVQENLKALKACVKSTLAEGLITLELGEADDWLADCLPALREAFQLVQASLTKAKARSRVLTFADLEVHASKALQDPEVCTYYARRWKVFLIDEFQDTNPVQSELLQTLTANTCLTIVGDVKQSIYGFRRADINVFEQFRDRILAAGGADVILDRSFRTHHQLMTQINQIFAPVLGAIHQNLKADRQQNSHTAPHLRVMTIQADKGIGKPQRQQAEAFHIAQTLKQMVDSGKLVHDKSNNNLRPLQYGDIAILSRTRAPLEIYGKTLEAQGIPVVETGGGNLLATRTAKDVLALLRFLADPGDDLALVAILRSPFFAVSDRVLFQVMSHELQGNQSHSDRDETRSSHLSWWQRVQSSDLLELKYSVKALGQLLGDCQVEAPSRLLQVADRLTGYTAVLANLAGADRRQADWRGMRDLIAQLERGSSDLFGVVRRCKQLIEADVEVPRLTLEAQNAVVLMTVHAAKGLEWAVVVVPDLTRSRNNEARSIYFDPSLGVALHWKEQESLQKPALYLYLDELKKQREAEEAKRVLYVALTRARDHLLLTAADESGGGLEILRPGLEAADIEVNAIPLTLEAAVPLPPPDPHPVSEPTQLLLGTIGTGLFDLPVTALTEYALCPKRFQFHFVEGYPGLGEGTGIARRVGILVHQALELDIRDAETLTRFDATLPPESIVEALGLVTRFDQSPEYAKLHAAPVQREQTVSLKLGQLTLNGVVDLVSADWVLDFKTDQTMAPKHHQFQLWAYATPLGRSTAHIAYLRHDRLHTFDEIDLAKLEASAHTLAQGIVSGRYPANPSLVSCKGCGYGEICEHQMIEKRVVPHSDDEPVN